MAEFRRISITGIIFERISDEVIKVSYLLFFKTEGSRFLHHQMP